MSNEPSAVRPVKRRKSPTNLSLSRAALKRADALRLRHHRPSLTNLVEALIHEAYAAQFAGEEAPTV